MKRIAISTALLLCSTAFADDFATRAASAKRASTTQEGAQYDAALTPFIGTAMQACILPGSTNPANLGSFTLVGNVSARGMLHAVVVEPRTRVSSCFAEHFGKTIFPKPPKTLQGENYPITVEMRVAP